LKFFALTSSITLIADSALAHGDHSSEAASSLPHLLSDPVHLTLIVLAGALAFGASRLSRRLSR